MVTNPLSHKYDDPRLCILQSHHHPFFSSSFSFTWSFYVWSQLIQFDFTTLSQRQLIGKRTVSDIDHKRNMTHNLIPNMLGVDLHIESSNDSIIRVYHAYSIYPNPTA